MDTAVILSKRRRLFRTRRDVRMHSCNPKKHRCVFFWGGEIKPQRTGAVQRWSSLLSTKMKETNNISHRAAITRRCEVEIAGEEPGPNWKPYFLCFFGFVISLRSLWDDVNRCTLCLFASFLTIKTNKHLKALFWCFIQTYFCLWSVRWILDVERKLSQSK